MTYSVTQVQKASLEKLNKMFAEFFPGDTWGDYNISNDDELRDFLCKHVDEQLHVAAVNTNSSTGRRSSSNFVKWTFMGSTGGIILAVLMTVLLAVILFVGERLVALPRELVTVAMIAEVLAILRPDIVYRRLHAKSPDSKLFKFLKWLFWIAIGLSIVGLILAIYVFPLPSGISYWGFLMRHFQYTFKYGLTTGLLYLLGNLGLIATALFVGWLISYIIPSEH